MARLRLETGGERRETKVAGTLTIGRSPSVSIPIDDKTLSREHTQVYVQGNRYFVRDLGSKNGTYLNNQLVKQPTPLKHGDRIRVGSASFMILWDPEDVAAEAPAAPAPSPAPATRTASAPRPAPATRPRSSTGSGAARFVGTLLFWGVLLGGTYVAKQVFVTVVFPMLPK